MSQAVILAAWGDVWAGTIANVLLLLIVAFSWLTEGPRSFHAQYLRDAQAGLERAVPTPTVTEADLVPLPDPVFAALLAFFAGMFLYFGAGSLLPQAHRSGRNRIIVVAASAAGIALAMAAASLG